MTNAMNWSIKPSRAGILFLLLAVIGLGLFLLIPGSAHLIERRDDHGAVLLKNGEVLVIGGSVTYPPVLWESPTIAHWLNSCGCGWLSSLWEIDYRTVEIDHNNRLATCEVFNPVTHTWRRVESLDDRGRDFPSGFLDPILLPNGNVLALGINGVDKGQVPEVFDGTHWKRTAPFLHPDDFQVVLLPGGVPLAVGTVDCELFDAETLTWEETSPRINGSYEPAVGLLSNGKVIVAGGDRDGFTEESEIYDPTRKEWHVSGDLFDIRSNPFCHLVRLPDGKTLMVGGMVIAQGAAHPSACALFDPVTEKWQMAGDFDRKVKWNLPCVGRAVRLNNGKVLAMSSNWCCLYESGHWTATAPMIEPRTGFTATLLEDGTVLVTGGIGDAGYSLSSCEIYDPKTEKWSRNSPTGW